ncbi:hypothetical protein INT46_002566 [Mucor plumbeus]|uniref:Uncharacterized protein n=1 Tax=Mucor plumbeus TaxID=97098 RepID=A0A8H7QIZ8_9FUNG|nr:hypothetical protein INT46_002566 [Mucor plumbeus]
MKLSFSLVLLAAAVGIQAAATPKAASKCIAGSSGKENGDGYNGYCCKYDDDCFESCIKGVCNGPTNTKTATKTTTAAPTSSGTPGTCVAGSAGLGNGDGYKGYCCKSSDDCFESCKSGVCNGPTNTKTATKTTSAVPTSSGTPGACVAGSAGLGNGDGYKGYCCKSSDDCFESCKSGVCNGPTNTKTTAPTSTPTDTDKACKAGYKGLGNGEGPTNACCSDSDDCQESCIDGKCKKA